MAERQWLIWSNEHAAWWGPDERGYTGVIEAAGRYAEAAARRIADRASLGGKLTVPRSGMRGEVIDVPPEVVVADPAWAPEEAADVSAIYLRLTAGKVPVARTVDYGGRVLVDLDKYGQPVGVEILGDAVIERLRDRVGAVIVEEAQT